MALLAAGGLLAGGWLGALVGDWRSSENGRKPAGLVADGERSDAVSGHLMAREPSRVMEALALCRLGSESGEMARAHYYALHAASILEASELAEFARHWAGERGFEAGTVQLIMLLELARRDGEALLALLREPRMSRLSPGTLSQLFFYWAAWDAETAMAAVERLPLGLRRAAISSMPRVLGPDGRGWIESMRDQIAMQEKEVRDREYEARQARQRAESQQQVAKLLEQGKWSDPHLGGLFSTAYYGDFQGGIEVIRSVANPWGRRMLIDALLSRHSASPTEGMASVAALYRDGMLKGEGNRLRHLRGLAREGLLRDVEATLAWMGSELNRWEQASLFSQMDADRISDAGTFLGSELLERLPESPVKMRLVDQAVGDLARKDWPAAVAWLEGKPPSPRLDQLRATLIGRAFETGGAEGAKQWIQNIDTPEARANAANHLASIWGRREPLAYAEWVSGLEDTEAMKRGMAQLGHYWAQSDPEEALQFAAALPAGELRNQMRMAVTNRLAQDNPLRAIEYAMGIESDREMKTAVRSAVQRWSRMDPIRSLEFLQSTFPDDREFDSHVSAAAQTWARTDPVAVVAYFSERADTEHGYLGLAAGLENWLNIDREAATEYLNQVPASKARDRLLLHTVTSAYRLLQDDELALQLAARIDDRDIREQASEYLSRHLPRDSTVNGGRP